MKALTPNERRASSRFSVEHSAPRISGLLLTVFVLFAAQSIKAQDTATRVETFTLPPNGTVRIENARGATQVRAWDGQVVRVIAEKKGDHVDRLEPSELVLMSAGNVVVVQCRQTNRPGRIDVTAYVPRQSRLEITGGSLPVDVSGSLSGAMIETTGGNIGYAVPPTDDARVSMHSTRGSVRSSVALKALDRSGSHWLQGTLGAGHGQIVLNTEAGNITLMASQGTVHPGSSRADVRSLVVNAAPASGDAIPTAHVGSASSWPGNDSAGAPDDSIATPRGAKDRSKKNDIDAKDAGTLAPDDLSIQPNGNSIGLAGGKRKNNSASTTKGGPFERDQSLDSTAEDSMGLSVRIIPSGVSRRDDSPRQSPSPSPGVDYTKYTYDNDGNLRPVRRIPAPGAAGSVQAKSDASSDEDSVSGVQPAANQSSSQGGSVALGGNKRNSNGASSTKGGPFERDQKESGNSDDSMGLSVKILPSSPSGNRAADRASKSRTVYDTDDNADSPRRQSSSRDAAKDIQPFDRDVTATAAHENRSLPGHDAPSAADSRDRANPSEADAPARDARSTAPPTLKRDSDASKETSLNGAAAANRKRDSDSDEEPLVLESALVNLNVSVTDRAGKAFGNLKREDFRIFENNEPQTVEFFASSNTPFNLVLLLDLSGSIQDKLKVIKSAALHFLDVIGPNDKVAVLAFTRSVRVISPLTGDRESLRNRIRNIEVAEGGTAFYEALWFAMSNTLRGTQGQRNAIVVMTDGVDNSLQQERRLYLPSRVPYNRLKERLEESDILVFPVYLDTEEEEVFERLNGSTQDYEIARMQLGQMAEETGGQMFVAREARDLAGVYSQVAAALRTVYSVGYYPTHPDRDGSFRRVRILSTRPEAVVKARKGYYAR